MSDGEKSAWGEATDWVDNTLGGKPADDEPIQVGHTEPTDEEKEYWAEQSRLSDQIAAHKEHLTTFVEHADQSGHILYASWPDLDMSSVDALTTELHQIANDANNALAGVAEGTAANKGFHTIAYWAQHAAGQSDGLAPLGDQERHATLSDLLNSLSNMHAGLSEI